MSEPPPKITEGSQPLDYQVKSQEKRSARSTVVLVLAILIAVFVGGLGAFGTLVMVASPQWYLGAASGSGIVLFTGGGIVANRKLGMSAALAIMLVSICVFLLMMGVCSQFHLIL